MSECSKRGSFSIYQSLKVSVSLWVSLSVTKSNLSSTSVCRAYRTNKTYRAYRTYRSYGALEPIGTLYTGAVCSAFSDRERPRETHPLLVADRDMQTHTFSD